MSTRPPLTSTAPLTRRRFLACSAAGAAAVLGGLAAVPARALALAPSAYEPTATSPYLSGAAAGTYTVKVDKGYLALRGAMAYDPSNELGALYTGDVVQVQGTGDAVYWWVYAPRLNRSGYVNRNYLVAGGVPVPQYRVSVPKGYLALRSLPEYDEANELGALYTGDVVQVQDKGAGAYWYVYAPRYRRCGYVNASYLVSTGSSVASGQPYTVSVPKGYLALRSAMAYDEANELGALYTGDVVYLQSMDSARYWYVYSPRYRRCGYVNASYLH